MKGWMVVEELVPLCVASPSIIYVPSYCKLDTRSHSVLNLSSLHCLPMKSKLFSVIYKVLYDLLPSFLSRLVSQSYLSPWLNTSYVSINTLQAGVTINALTWCHAGIFPPLCFCLFYFLLLGCFSHPSSLFFLLFYLSIPCTELHLYL